MKLVMLVMITAIGLLGVQIERASASPEKKDLVILVHGLGRSASSMWLMEDRLREDNYDICAVNYPSRSSQAKDIVVFIHQQIKACSAYQSDNQRKHFVTHSMGGPLVRMYLDMYAMNTLGRVVMLSPPNNGSHLIEILGDHKFFGSVLGPAASGLTRHSNSWLTQLPKPAYEVGIIAGNFTLNPVLAYLLPGKDDGAVSVEDMKMKGMRAFTEVDATHVTIRYSKTAYEQTIHFLQNGEFKK